MANDQQLRFSQIMAILKIIKVKNKIQNSSFCIFWLNTLKTHVNKSGDFS
jgi:hypothetical protein